MSNVDGSYLSAVLLSAQPHRARRQFDLVDDDDGYKCNKDGRSLNKADRGR